MFLPEECPSTFLSIYSEVSEGGSGGGDSLSGCWIPMEEARMRRMARRRANALVLVFHMWFYYDIWICFK